MCPSYMVTLEEQHSTRGRAHMLFELLQGEVVRDAWQDEHVKKALDLCLSCKACKSECPTNVDIATYRAEFLSHYYESKRRGRCTPTFLEPSTAGRDSPRSLPARQTFSAARPASVTCFVRCWSSRAERKLPRFATTHFKVGRTLEKFRPEERRAPKRMPLRMTAE